MDDKDLKILNSINNKTQSRWRSKAAWASLLPLILLLGDTYGLWNVINMPKETFVQIVTTLGSILVAGGILNNPTDKNGF